jgi:uncharacterized protein (TIGR00299 family) protein|tara:strand:- start:465 stop:1673 length:1209 start_codon:yes stop_codon:yes gene_type:complete
MKVAYIDIVGGVSGDMLIGAMIDVGLELDSLKLELKKIQKTGWKIEKADCFRGGLPACSITVGLSDNSPGVYKWENFHNKIENSDLPSSDIVKIKSIFGALENAETEAHSKDLKPPHLHELGTLDTLIDVASFVIGMRLLKIDELYCSSFPVGTGQFINMHGAMGATSLAVSKLYRHYGVPVRSDLSMPPGEFVTPTAVATLCCLVKDFKSITFIPETVGYGAGDKNPESYSNVTGIWIGKKSNVTEFDKNDEDIILLETNIDDASGEIIGYVQNLLIEKGCRDVWVTPIQMKKNRPSILLSVLTDAKDEKDIVEIIMKETPTLGIRRKSVERHIASREIVPVSIPYGDIKVKIKKLNGKIIQINPEYEDCAKLAKSTGIPLHKIYEMVDMEALEVIDRLTV